MTRRKLNPSEDEWYYPAMDAFTITPHDVNEVANITKAIYVGAEGGVKVTMMDGTDVTFAAVPAGQWLPIRVRKVFATGTSAGSLVGLF